MDFKNSQDYGIEAAQHERDAANMRAKADQARKFMQGEKARLETDIAAAEAQIARLEPYQDDSVDNSSAIASYKSTIEQLQRQLDTEVPRMERELAEHEKAFEDHTSAAKNMRSQEESAKQAEKQQQIEDMAHRAQQNDPNANDPQ